MIRAFFLAIAQLALSKASLELLLPMLVELTVLGVLCTMTSLMARLHSFKKKMVVATTDVSIPGGSAVAHTGMSPGNV